MKKCYRAVTVLGLLLVFVLGSAVPAFALTRPRLSAWTSYSVFSPDGDGSRETVRVSYRVPTTARVWVRIYNGSTLVRTLRYGTRTLGTRSVSWNGITGGGAAADEGAYRVAVTAKIGTLATTRRTTVTLKRATLPARRWVGFYVPGAPMSIDPLNALESLVATRAAVSNFFQNTSGGFPLTQATNASNHGSIPMATLEFWNPANGVNQPAYSLKAIAGGSWDAYLHKYAQNAKAFGNTVFLRPLHEMNGNWYPWGGTVNGNTPADFVAAWRHIKDIFTAEGASNVAFVWSPNADSVPNTTANAIGKYWPGDAYVDYIALDGYNFGGTRPWRSFSSVFGAAYSTVTALSTKPVFIAETACGTVGGDKAAWIADMFKVIPTSFGRISGVTWFNANKERDWRVESSPASLAAFRAGVTTF